MQLLKLAIVDDHKLFRKGLINLIQSVTNNVQIIFEADNGLQLQQKISSANEPDIILMDINMPGMDGYESVTWLRQNHPLVKVLIISMVEKEESIVQMLKLGVKGYLSKDVEPGELSEALLAISNKGYYYTDFITGRLVHSLQTENASANKNGILLNDREKEFLKLACTDLTYSEIASKMFLSPKTIDGYRSTLFEKLAVKNRVGLALYAVKSGLVIL